MTSLPSTFTSPVAEAPLRPRYGPVWRLALAICALLLILLALTLGASLALGVGLWGINIPFVWGFDLVNYAWWIGIANGASLFAAILVLRRHSLRTAVNRFAEAVALAAAVCAGLFPIVHLGRPWLFYWVFPYPATSEVWPQFRSTLTWDFWGILSHIVVIGLLWYVGLIPDFATLRDRARRPAAQRAYGLLALGWRNSVRHWSHHQAAYRLVAILVLPLLTMMQSIVALEFATTLVPAWHDTRLPLHFVATGLAQGLAMVLLVAMLLRWGLALERHIDDRDVDLLGRLVVASALASAFLSLEEIAAALLAEPSQWAATVNRITGPRRGAYMAAVVLGVLVPQLLWLRAARRSVIAATFVGASVSLGVWFDRFSIVVGGAERDYLPSLWRSYAPTLVESGLFIGTVGLFGALLLIFARFVPAVSLFESRHDEQEERT